MGIKNKTIFKTGIMVAFAAIIADQLHKYVMLHHFGFIDNRYVEVTGFFNLVMVWNYGISFGMFNNGSNSNAFILVGMSVAIVSFLIYWLYKTETRYQAIAIGLVIGGALGNAIDRTLYGAVADFFDFYIGTFHWPAFNIADSLIFIGVFLLVIESFFKRKELDTK